MPVPTRPTQYYIYTLDSHDCFGPFIDRIDATVWATRRQKTSYQVLTRLPYSTTLVLLPY